MSTSKAPSNTIRWVAFLGWLVLPIAATAVIVKLTSTDVLWWGPIWTGFALVYMIIYFRWVRKRHAGER